MADSRSAILSDRILIVEVLPQYFDDAYTWIKEKSIKHSSYFMWSDCVTKNPSAALIEFDELSDALFCKLAFGGK